MQSQRGEILLRLVSLELQMINHFKQVANENGVRLTVTDCRAFNRKGMSLLLQLEGNHWAMQRAVKSLRKQKGVRELYDSGVNGNRTLCLTVLDRPFLCDASMATGVVCMQCPYNEAEVNPTWQVLVSKPDDIRELTSRLQKQGVGAKIKSISQVNQEELLTGRQKEILATAISLGYFDFPRKISLTALSDKVGIRPSTLSEVLRSAERKIIENVAKSIKLPVYATGQAKE
jgi:hypothetical protein